MKRWVLIGLAVLLSLPIAMIALSEAGEVVVIRSAGEGEPETRIWVVDTPEGLLVRGSEGKAWVAAAQRAGHVEIDRTGSTRRYRVVAQPGEEPRSRINALMREKYGFADRAISSIRDYSKAVPLLLREEAR